MELVTKWEVRKRGINPLRIVVNRLYPRAVHEGRPDLIENAVRIGADGEDIWQGRMPAAVFTVPSTPKSTA
jgi:hypothetical protein